MRICTRKRDWPACVKFHAVDYTHFKFQFSAGCVTEFTTVSAMRCVPRLTLKWALKL
jgi:hypothetical protein